MVEFFSRGGLIHYTWQLARAMRTLVHPGTEIILLTAPHPESPAPWGVRLLTGLHTWNPHCQPRVWPRRLVRAGRGLRYAAAWFELLHAVRRLQPRVVLLSDLEHRCDAWFVPRLRRQLHRQAAPGVLADIWHNVEPFDRYHRGRLLRRLRWRAPMARHFDAIFVHGEALAEQFHAQTGYRSYVIPHGNQEWMVEQAGPDPSLDARLHLPRDRPLALLFGALSPYKGVEVLLAAMAVLTPAERPGLLIAGMATATAELAKWRRQARGLGLERWLRWDVRYIPAPDVAWYFRRADFVVLPYRVASQSGVGNLALTFGKPLIVTASGGLPELIDGNGEVVPAGEAAPLARAMARVSSSADLRWRWGQRSAELATARHAWQPIARTVLACTAPGALFAASGIATKDLPQALAGGGISERER